jgi:hypothetical protein
MYWKIIMPLAKLIKSKTGKDLPVVISGITNSFTLKLSSGNVSIWVLQGL